VRLLFPTLYRKASRASSRAVVRLFGRPHPPILWAMAKSPRVGDTIKINDRMQKRYNYVIEA